MEQGFCAPTWQLSGSLDMRDPQVNHRLLWFGLVQDLILLQETAKLIPYLDYLPANSAGNAVGEGE